MRDRYKLGHGVFLFSRIQTDQAIDLDRLFKSRPQRIAAGGRPTGNASVNEGTRKGSDHGRPVLAVDEIQSRGFYKNRLFGKKLMNKIDVIKLSACFKKTGFDHQCNSPIKIPDNEKTGLWKGYNFKAKCRNCGQWIVAKTKNEFL